MASGFGPRLRPTYENFIEVYEFAKWSILNGFLGDIYHRIDTFYLAFFVGSVVVGHYESSVRIMTAFVLSFSMGRVVTAKMSGLAEEGEEYFTQFRGALHKLLVLVFVYFLVIAIFGKQILTVVYGPEYTEAYLLLVGLTLQMVIQTARLMYESLLYALDFPDRVTRVVIVAVVFNPITAPPLIIAFGGIGMVISTVLAELLRSIYFHYRVYTEEGEDSVLVSAINRGLQSLN